MLFHYIKTNKNTNRLINYSQLDEQASIILHLNDPTKYNSGSPLKFTSSRKHFLPPPISFHHCLSRRVFICNVSTVVIISSRSNRSPIYSAKGKMVTYNILNVLSRSFFIPIDVFTNNDYAPSIWKETWSRDCPGCKPSYSSNERAPLFPVFALVNSLPVNSPHFRMCVKLGGVLAYVFTLFRTEVENRWK